MQLDIFEHSRGVMLRNYVAQALEQDDAAFVQINGDVIQALNRSQVEAALRHTKSARASYAHTAAHRFRPRMRAQWL